MGSSMPSVACARLMYRDLCGSIFMLGSLLGQHVSKALGSVVAVRMRLGAALRAPPGVGVSSPFRLVVNYCVLKHGLRARRLIPRMCPLRAPSVVTRVSFDRHCGAFVLFFLSRRPLVGNVGAAPLR